MYTIYLQVFCICIQFTYEVKMLKKRYLQSFIEEDLAEKMVFLGGPRQVGKTTLATEVIGHNRRSQYYNWDKKDQRIQALEGKWMPDQKLIILDEFHKYRKWKTWIKGEYDVWKEKYQFLLTGSARLNVYRRGGDSLQGRYHYYRLHPFSVSELEYKIPKLKPGDEPLFHDSKVGHFDDLFRFGGFPDPLFKQNERFLRRWHNERVEKIIEEDIRDLTLVQDIGNLTLLAELLLERTSSICSVNSLAQDLGVNYRTAENWLNIFEELFYCFRLDPFFSKKIAAVRKEKKLYLWDWSQVKDPSERIENIVASHLLKFCHYLKDVEGWKTSLYYLRDHTGREVDFLVTCDLRPWFAVEVKNKDHRVSSALYYFQEKLKIPYCYQVIHHFSKDYLENNVRIMPLSKFLSALV